jgi:hypothetical protein
VPFFDFIIERYEVRYRAGSGLFLILLAFSSLKFKKVGIRGKEQFGTTIYPAIVTVWRIFLAFWSCRPESAFELVIPCGIPFLRWIPRP